MKQKFISVKLLVFTFAFVAGYTVTCGAQTPSNREDEEAIKHVITCTTEAFNQHDAKAFMRFYTQDAELVTVRGERMKGAAEIEKGLPRFSRLGQRPRRSRP